MEAQWCLALWFLGLDDHPLRRRLGNRCCRRSGRTAPGRSITARRMATSTRPWKPTRRCARSGTRTTSPRWRRRSNGSLERRLAQYPRLHPLLARADRRMAVGEDPNAPPEVVWLPLWFPFSIYNFAQWARATLMPVAVLSARRPSRPLPPKTGWTRCSPAGARLRLRSAGQGRRRRMEHVLPRGRQGVARLAKYRHKLGVGLWRGAAIRQTLEWIIRHQDADGAWGGIQPPWIYSLMALHVEGYATRPSGPGQGPAASTIRAGALTRAQRPSFRPPTAPSGIRC